MGLDPTMLPAIGACIVRIVINVERRSESGRIDGEAGFYAPQRQAAYDYKLF